MIHTLLTGTLAGDPVERTSAKGDRFVTANLRVPAGPESIFIGAAAFDRTSADRLAELKKGSPIAAAGEFQPNNWVDREGVEHRDWRLLVNEVLTVSQAARRRKRAQDDQDGGGNGQ